MPGAPWWAKLAWCPSMWWCTFHQFFPNLSLAKNCWNELKSLLGVTRLLSRRVAVMVASTHEPFLKKAESFPPLSMAHTLLNRVENFHSAWPLCWGVSGVVYSKSILIPSCLQSLLKSAFSPPLLQCSYRTWIPYLVFKNLDISFKKKLDA